MDALDKLILDKRAERESVSARLTALDFELKTLEQAASLRPAVALPVRNRNTTIPDSVAAEVSSVIEPRKGHGKARGSISMKWREALESLYDLGPKPYENYLLAAKSAGIESDLSSIRARVREFIKMGYVDGTPNEGFAVTEAAATRFGFTKVDEAPAEAEASNESLDPGDQTGAA